MAPSFVHLRLHSEYSLVDGLVNIKSLMKALPNKALPAVALTDHCNLFAAVKFYKAALDAGIKPIFGAEIPLIYPQKPQNIYSLVLLCQNQVGYRHLTELISKGYQEGQIQGKPYIHMQWLQAYSEGLIALSGGRRGELGQLLLQEDMKAAEALARQYMALFPNRFYIEVMRTGRKDESRYNEKAVALADALSLPLVATNDVCFLESDDFDAHEARVCIHDGFTLGDIRRERRYAKDQYLKSAMEMQTLFEDLPQALENTVEIAKRCNVMLDLGHNYLPNFPIPNDTTIEAYLDKVSKLGLEERFKKLLAPIASEDLESVKRTYLERLQVEIDVINRMGFAGYFLIVADFIQWAKDNGVPVGPGRGSGAGSLVAYALKITDLDPLAYDLLFERFLNPERVSMPDFDIDFCMEGRDRVIEYVAQKYGRESVSQIITFGTMAAKAVVRDVGRVLGHPYGFVDTLAKLIPFELGITLSKAMEDEPELRRRYEEEEDVKELFDLAFKLEGVTRNAGKHAGGVVIAPSRLTDFTAIYCEEGSSQLVTQFDKDDVEASGLVKFDFLGLRTLTIIDWALKTINTRSNRNEGELPLDINDIPLDDEKTFTLLKACQTTAVFQLESRGMKEIISRLQPDCFEDIIALVALFRPGPLQSGMVDDFIDRKHGRAPVIYPHPDLEPILKPTYGVILYQEQVMQIAQVLANYTLGAADLLRRAMGKKKPEEMAKQRAIFTEGAEARGVDASVATHIFDLMEKFAGYGFNKSHSAAYALVAYQTAWLKAHFKAAFMAAVMSSDMDNTDKVVNFIDECTHLSINVIPPHINRSLYHFSVVDDKTILFGLGAIKGVGEAAIDIIIQARETLGEFESLYDLCEKVDTRKVNRRVLETLIKCGALDSFNLSRATLLASLESAIRHAELYHANHKSGQGDLFMSLMSEDDGEREYVEAPPWPLKEMLQAEKETLGFYLSGHPSDPYCAEFRSIVTPMSMLDPNGRKKANICGQVIALRKVLTKRGKTLVILGVEDRVHKMDVVVFGEIFDNNPSPVKTGDFVVIEGEISVDEFRGGVRMVASLILTPTEVRNRYAKSIIITLSPEDEVNLPAIQSVLSAHKGDLALQIQYKSNSAEALLYTGSAWKIQPSDAFIQEMTSLIGAGKVTVGY